MSSLLTTLGLRASTPGSIPNSLAGHYLVFHFIFGYVVLAPRHLKQYHGLDHNVSPREDLSKYGPEAVRSGKITQAQLDQMKRVESASANSVENFVFFTGAMLWAQMAGVPAETVNAWGLAYTLARVGYAAVYVLAGTERMSLMRPLFWWVGNVACLRLFWVGSKAMNMRA